MSVLHHNTKELKFTSEKCWCCADFFVMGKVFITTQSITIYIYYYSVRFPRWCQDFNSLRLSDGTVKTNDRKSVDGSSFIHLLHLYLLSFSLNVADVRR